MAEEAQELLAGSGWLPEPLRTPGLVFGPAVEAAAPDATESESAADAGQSRDEPEPAEADPSSAEWPVAAE